MPACNLQDTFKSLLHKFNSWF